MKNTRETAFLAVVSMAMVVCAAPAMDMPTLANLRVEQMQGYNLVEVNYDVVGQSRPFTVNVSFFDFSSPMYNLGAQSFSGDGYGGGVASGSRRVVWDAGRDWPGRSSTQVWVKLMVRETSAASYSESGRNMAQIPAGWFWMGDSYSQGSANERPLHAVYVSEFQIGKYEVTNDEMVRVLQWAYDQGKIKLKYFPQDSSYLVLNAECGGGNTEIIVLSDKLMDIYPGSTVDFVDGAFRVGAGVGSHPCNMATWFGAQYYCNYLSDMEGLQRHFNVCDPWQRPYDFSVNGYRLPTEAEWEKAARGGLEGHHFPWWSPGGPWRLHIDGSMANYSESSYTELVPVASYMPNGYGLYDMAGNVMEWCYDYYSANYYSYSPNIDPTGPDGSSAGTGYFVNRDGYQSYSHPSSIRCAFRYYKALWNTAGFRIARRGGASSADSVSVPQNWASAVSGPITVDTQGGSPGLAQMEVEKTWARERAGTIIISVVRLGGTNGAASVGYATADGTARAGVDYIVATGTVSWADGERGDKPIVVSLITNAVVEGRVSSVEGKTTNSRNSRNFLVNLLSAQGATLGSSTSSLVTLHGKPAANDFNGDGISDLALFNTTAGTWYIKTLGGSVEAWGVSWGWNGAEPVGGDYDGDGISDLAVFDQNSGAWYVSTVSGSLIAWNQQWGWPGAEPVSGDYDGDGISDLAVFDQMTGNWYLRTMSGTIFAWAVPWGWPANNPSGSEAGRPGAQPVPGDYDGDGISDLAVCDLNTGNWYIRTMSGTILAWSVLWGLPGATPVPGDYDNDGISDLAIWDPASGYWFIRTMSGTVLAWAVPWGWNGLTPVSGDYDGDGSDDLALFDSTTGRWYIRSLAGALIALNYTFGWSGASAVSN